jgi:two-component system CheB/CheR fusion protein
MQTASGQWLEAGDAGALYQQLTDAAVALMQSDMGSLQVVDEARDGLRILAWNGFGDAFGDSFALILPDSKTSCAEARRTGRRVIVPDIEAWNPLAGTAELEMLRRHGIRAVQSTPLFSRRGRLIGMISTHWRTPHEPTEEDLRPLDTFSRQAANLLETRWADEATARLAAIVESSDDAIISKDLNGIITSWNKGAERLLGYTAAEAVGKPVALLIPLERLDEEPSILERIRRGVRIDHYETVRRRKDGSLIDISLTVSPIADAEGRIIGAAKIARDITARKQQEQALIEADRRKNEFLAMLAHELRGPLAPVRNSLQIVRAHGHDPAAVAAAATMMERQVAQMTRLIDDLIDVSRITLGKLEIRMERIELVSAIRSIAEATLPLAESQNQRLRVELPAQPIAVLADPARLAQVVGNLLNNASKFTEKGGRIDLVVATEGNEAVIRVEDTGIGIAARDLPGIFDMFSQVDSSLERSQGGLGIGLSLVRSVIAMHGGTVTAESPGPGRGSTFTVRLPMLAVASVPAETEPFVAPIAGARRRVLIVDDNRDSLDSLALLLNLGGHEVCSARDGVEAVEAAASFGPELVLLDIGLPRLNGYEAAARIRQLPGGAAIKLVALSGWGQEEDRRRSRDAGFDLHLVKPVDPQVLGRLLARLDADPSRNLL